MDVEIIAESTKLDKKSMNEETKDFEDDTELERFKELDSDDLRSAGIDEFDE